MISTGRTGTKYFSRFFREYIIDVASYHTTNYTRFINVVGNLYALKLLPPFFAGKIWKALKYDSIKSHRLRYIENNPHYYSLTNMISGYFPQAKYIYVVRSPKSYILSHFKKEDQHIKSKIANCLVPFWQPISYFEQVKGLFGDFYQRVEFYADIWNYKNNYLLSVSRENTQYMTIRFEDVFDPGKGPDILKQLADWLGLVPKRRIDSSVLLEKVNSSKADQKIFWDERCNKIVADKCMALMKIFQYLK